MKGGSNLNDHDGGPAVIVVIVIIKNHVACRADQKGYEWARQRRTRETNATFLPPRQHLRRT